MRQIRKLKSKIGRGVIRSSTFGIRFSFGFWISLFGILLLVAGCRKEMYDQPRHKPLQSSSFFKDGMSARPLLAGTVPRGFLRTNDALYEGLNGTNLVENIPLRITKELLTRGHERYNIYCSVCHDQNGDGNGMVVQRGFPRPPSYHIDRLRQAPAGHFYRVITYGYGVMYPYASRVSPEDRWAITAYIRALQLSHGASATEAANKSLLPSTFSERGSVTRSDVERSAVLRLTDPRSTGVKP
jgi:mono/diheme cytochrome c family protein